MKSGKSDTPSHGGNHEEPLRWDVHRMFLKHNLFLDFAIMTDNIYPLSNSVQSLIETQSVRNIYS